MSEEDKLLKRVSITSLGISILLSLLVMIFHRFESSLFTFSGGIFSIFFFFLLKGIAFKFLEKRSFIYVVLYFMRLVLIGSLFYVIILISKKEILYFFIGFLSIIFGIMVEGFVQFVKLKRGTE
jgi:hypothetical protein